MKQFAALIAFLLTSCAQLGLTPEQLEAMEGQSASTCIVSPGWNGSPVQVHTATFGGKSTGTGGGGGKATCGSSVVEFTNEGKASSVTTDKEKSK